MVDETYAADPTQYNYTTFLQQMNISAADAPFYAFGETGVVLRCAGLPTRLPPVPHSLSQELRAVAHAACILTHNMLT